MKRTTKSISITLPFDMLKDINAYAWEKRLDRSTVIRIALMPFLRKNKAICKGQEKGAVNGTDC